MNVVEWGKCKSEVRMGMTRGNQLSFKKSTPLVRVALPSATSVLSSEEISQAKRSKMFLHSRKPGLLSLPRTPQTTYPSKHAL